MCRGATWHKTCRSGDQCYPDGTVTCEDVDLGKTYVVAPKLAAEAISPRSVKRDCVTKLDIYRAIPAVEEDLMVDSRKA